MCVGWKWNGILPYDYCVLLFVVFQRVSVAELFGSERRTCWGEEEEGGEVAILPNDSTDDNKLAGQRYKLRSNQQNTCHVFHFVETEVYKLCQR